jgi:hypothetical protein
MDVLAQLLIVIPYVALFAVVVAALARQENERFHSLEAAYRRRHRMRVRSAVRFARRDEESLQSHDSALPERHAA